jgi:hypothetical protein
LKAKALVAQGRMHISHVRQTLVRKDARLSVDTLVVGALEWTALKSLERWNDRSRVDRSRVDRSR